MSVNAAILEQRPIWIHLIEFLLAYFITYHCCSILPLIGLLSLTTLQQSATILSVTNDTSSIKIVLKQWRLSFIFVLSSASVQMQIMVCLVAKGYVALILVALLHVLLSRDWYTFEILVLMTLTSIYCIILDLIRFSISLFYLLFVGRNLSINIGTELQFQ